MERWCRELGHRGAQEGQDCASFPFLLSLLLFLTDSLPLHVQVKTVKLLLVDEETNEVLATSTARVETDIAGTLHKDGETGVTTRRGTVRGEIEL